jgi:hypothetical protein
VATGFGALSDNQVNAGFELTVRVIGRADQRRDLHAVGMGRLDEEGRRGAKHSLSRRCGA